MTTQLEEIFINDSQLFRTSVYDTDGMTLLTPTSCVCSVWNRDTGVNIVNGAAGTVGSGYAQYNWSGSATAGNFEAVLTVTISSGVIKSENFLVTVLAKPPSSAHILTPEQAANALRVETSDVRMLDLLPQVDKFVERATGRDWTQDASKHPLAAAAATMLCVMWFDNPSMIGDAGSMPFGLTFALAQLEGEALRYRTYQFYGATGAGGISVPGARVGDDVISLVGVYGVSGSQVANFETEISVKGQIQQTSSSDLSANLYVLILKNPADDILP